MGRPRGVESSRCGPPAVEGCPRGEGVYADERRADLMGVVVRIQENVSQSVPDLTRSGQRASMIPVSEEAALAAKVPIHGPRHTNLEPLDAAPERMAVV